MSGTSWICRGSNGGSDEPCTLTQPIVNGRCGIGSGTNFGDCSAGTSSGNTNPWTCAGSNGGVDVTCEFGVCNDTTTPHCDVGDFENITGTLEWRCEGNIDNTLVDNATCVIAVCGRTQGTCDEGTGNGINPWTCAGGAGHGTADDVNCYVGACGTADDPGARHWLHGRRLGTRRRYRHRGLVGLQGQLPRPGYHDGRYPMHPGAPHLRSDARDLR